VKLSLVGALSTVSDKFKLKGAEWARRRGAHVIIMMTLTQSGSQCPAVLESEACRFVSDRDS
jgi:hypothetical protein